MDGSSGLEWQGRKVVDPSDDKVGTIGLILVDQRTGAPEWARVSGGLFTATNYVPLVDARPEGDLIRIPLYRDRVRSAPAVRGDLTRDDEALLYRWYGYEDLAVAAETALRDDPADMREGQMPADVTETGADDDADADGMVRHEEHLDVATVTQPVERIRLLKRVVTEEATATVTVRREELVIEREPVEEADSELDAGATVAETDYVVTLYREVPVVSTRVVPVERVVLRKALVSEEVEVGGEVRVERIDVERDGDGG